MARLAIFAFGLSFAQFVHSGGGGEVVKFVEMKDGILQIAPSDKAKGFVDLFSTCSENAASVHLDKSRWKILRAILLGRDAAWLDLDRFTNAEAYLNSLHSDQRFMFAYMGSSISVLEKCYFRVSSLDVILDSNGEKQGVQSFRSY